MMITKMICEILTLAREVTANTDHDVFVDYAAHIDSLGVGIHLGGWKAGVPQDERFTAYLDKASGVASLRGIKDRLSMIEPSNYACDYEDIERVA